MLYLFLCILFILILEILNLYDKVYLIKTGNANTKIIIYIFIIGFLSVIILDYLNK